jgi:hypothetical protein
MADYILSTNIIHISKKVNIKLKKYEKKLKKRVGRVKNGVFRLRGGVHRVSNPPFSVFNPNAARPDNRVPRAPPYSSSQSNMLICLIPLRLFAGSGSIVNRYLGLWSDTAFREESSRSSVFGSKTLCDT